MTALVIQQHGDEISSFVLAHTPLIGKRPQQAPALARLHIADGLRDALFSADWEALRTCGARLGRLLGPALDVLKASREGAARELSLVLDEASASLPWELATVGDGLLLERYSCGRTVVLDEARWGAQRAAARDALRPPVRVLLVGDTRLAWAKREIDELDRRLRADSRFALPSVLYDPDPEALVANLRQKDLVHFAGHSLATEEDPRRNGWQLIGGTLSPAYVATLALESWPALVFASACPVTDPLHMSADPLALAMLRNGAGHYISTFAPIADSQMTVDFALGLYEGLLRGQRIGAAMSDARRRLAWPDHARSLRGSIAAAHYVLYGDPSEVLIDADRVPAAPVEPVARLGPYRVCAPAGEDAARTFYLAQIDGGAEVLLAVVRGCPPSERDGFLESLSRLRERLDGASHLVGVVDGGRERDAVFAVQPAPHATLDVAVRRPVGEARALLEALIAAVSEAHQRGVRHGELRPEAFEQGRDGRWLLRDAGWAELRLQHRLPGAAPRDPYRSPEQWVSAVPVIDEAADLWALAVIGFELLAGQHPFARAHGADGSWKSAVTSGEADLALLPADLADAFRQALAPERSARFRTTRDLLAAIRGAAVSDAFEPHLGGALAAALEGGGGVFFVNTADEPDTLGRLRSMAASHDMAFATWSVTSGLIAGGGPVGDNERRLPTDAVRWLAAQPRPTLLAALDFDAYLDDWQVSHVPVGQPRPGFEIFREFHAAAGSGLSTDFYSRVASRDPWLEGPEDETESAVALPKAELRRAVASLAARERTIRGGPAASSRGRPSGRPDADPVPHVLAIVAKGFVVPEDLSKRIQVFHARPASRDAVLRVLREERADREPWAAKFAWYAAGLTLSAVRDVVRLSRVRHGSLTAAVVDELVREKSQVVRRGGLLEFLPADVTLADDVVGAHAFRWWVAERSAAFADPIRAAVLPGAQGVVLGGLVGTGKSLCARAVAGELGWPLLRLDVGRIFTSLLGGAEENLREALAMAEAMGPVVLLLDDLDRALGRGQGGGVSGRVMNTLLTWMQERSPGVFLAATIGDPGGLPIEVVRAGRFDHIFFFDLPTTVERGELVAHCLRRHGRNPALHALDEAAAATKWLNHADIVGRVEASLFDAAAQGRLEPAPAELLAALRFPEVTKQRTLEIERAQRLWSDVARASEPEIPGLER